MVKVVRKCGFWFLICGVLTVASVVAQDLGSSSGIFRPSNPKTSKKTTKPAPKTTAPRKKAEIAKTTAPRPSRTTAPKTSKPVAKTPVGGNKTTKNSPNKTRNKTQANNQPVKSIETKSGNVVINIGKKNDSVDEKLEEAIDEGNTARDERDYAASEKAYRRAQSLRPRDSRALYGLGNIFSDQRRWEEAEKSYRQAIALEPESPEAHIALSYVLAQPVAGVNLSERYAEAEKMARRAVESDGENAVAYDQLGASLELGGKIGSETEQAYRKAIKLAPDFALAYAHLGRLLRRNGLNNESAAAYRDAIRLASDIPTMILVAEVMQSQQRYTDSEYLLRRALREDPKNPNALFLLGRALTTSGNFEEAESLLKRSIEVSPNSFVGFVQLGSLYARRGNYAEAEKTLMQALRIVSGNERKQLAQEFEMVGDGFLRVGRRADAARVYRQAVMLDGEKTDLANKLTEAQKS
jgi:tetratricopeptide (TPR) repeat protein